MQHNHPMQLFTVVSHREFRGSFNKTDLLQVRLVAGKRSQAFAGRIPVEQLHLESCTKALLAFRLTKAHVNKTVIFWDKHSVLNMIASIKKINCAKYLYLSTTFIFGNGSSCNCS